MNYDLSNSDNTSLFGDGKHPQTQPHFESESQPQQRNRNGNGNGNGSYTSLSKNIQDCKYFLAVGLQIPYNVFLDVASSCSSSSGVSYSTLSALEIRICRLLCEKTEVTLRKMNSLTKKGSLQLNKNEIARCALAADITLRFFILNFEKEFFSIFRL